MGAFLLPFRISNSSTHIIVSHAFNMSYQRGGFSNFSRGVVVVRLTEGDIIGISSSRFFRSFFIF